MTAALSRCFAFALPDMWPVIAGLVAGMVGAVYFVLILRLLQRHPTTLVISMLGFPKTGKTVYLTILFDELQRAAESGLTFYPYGLETIEQVSGNLNSLTSGAWLARTQPATVFFYRANATLGTGFFRRQYKIEIGDYAGEMMDELNPATDRWLHRTDYFKYVCRVMRSFWR